MSQTMPLWHLLRLTPCLLLPTLVACTTRDDTEGITASGIIESEEVVVGTKVSGIVEAIYAREGTMVKKGDSLLRIDDSELQIQVDAQAASLEAATAQYQLVVKGARSEDIDQAEEVVQQAKLALEAARDDVRRLETTISSGGVTEKMVADARSRAAIAERALQAAQAGVRKLRSGARVEEVRAARARVDAADAALRSARRRADDCTLTSPIDGIITRRAFDVGELIPTGASTFTVSRTDRVRLKIYVAENELGRVRLGQPARVTIDTYSDRSFAGRVAYISPTAEFTPKNVQTKDDRTKLVFEVWVEVANPGGELKSGLAAEAVLHDKPARSSSNVRPGSTEPS